MIQIMCSILKTHLTLLLVISYKIVGELNMHRYKVNNIRYVFACYFHLYIAYN